MRQAAQEGMNNNSFQHTVGYNNKSQMLNSSQNQYNTNQFTS